MKNLRKFNESEEEGIKWDFYKTHLNDVEYKMFNDIAHHFQQGYEARNFLKFLYHYLKSNNINCG